MPILPCLPAILVHKTKWLIPALGNRLLTPRMHKPWLSYLLTLNKVIRNLYIYRNVYKAMHIRKFRCILTAYTCFLQKGIIWLGHLSGIQAKIHHVLESSSKKRGLEGPTGFFFVPSAMSQDGFGPCENCCRLAD